MDVKEKQMHRDTALALFSRAYYDTPTGFGVSSGSAFLHLIFTHYFLSCTSVLLPGVDAGSRFGHTFLGGAGQLCCIRKRVLVEWMDGRMNDYGLLTN